MHHQIKREFGNLLKKPSEIGKVFVYCLIILRYRIKVLFLRKEEEKEMIRERED